MIYLACELGKIVASALVALMEGSSRNLARMALKSACCTACCGCQHGRRKGRCVKSAPWRTLRTSDTMLVVLACSGASIADPKEGSASRIVLSVVATCAQRVPTSRVVGVLENCLK